MENASCLLLLLPSAFRLLPSASCRLHVPPATAPAPAAVLFYGLPRKPPFCNLRSSAQVLGGFQMNIAARRTSLYLCLFVLIVFLVIANACQRSDTNLNMNSNSTVNANTNTAAANANTNANTNAASESISSIAAREPEKYRATLVFSAETEGGQKTIGIPTLSAEVARNGADRRVAFKLPDGSDLISLEQGDK